jgi:hypothetical protein
METDSGRGGTLDADQGYEAQVAEEKALLNSLIKVDETRPIYTAIRNAFIDRFARYYVCLKTTLKVLPHKESETIVESIFEPAPAMPESSVQEIAPSKLDEMESSWKPLVSMLFDRSSLWAVRDWKQPEIVKYLRRHLARPWHGRPATTVKFAIQAKELRLLDPDKWTWSKIVEKLCHCGKAHTDACGDNLRRDILQVETTLRRLGIDFEPRKRADLSPVG